MRPVRRPRPSSTEWPARGPSPSTAAPTPPARTNTLIQTITVNPDGTWATAPPADLTTDTYAEVVQNLNGVITTVIIPVAMSRPAVAGDRQQRPRSGDQRDEQGQILVLVLAMLILLGILVGALAGLAAPSFAHAAVVRNLNDTVADANSGIEYGIQALKDNAQPVPGCRSPSRCRAPPATMPPFNGHAGTLTCQQVNPPLRDSAADGNQLHPAHVDGPGRQQPDQSHRRPLRSCR